MNITFSQAVDGFMIDKRAERLSEHTLRDYTNAFRKFAAYLEGDLPIVAITSETVARFQAMLGETAIAPAGIAPRQAKPLSKKSILNIHTALSSLWTWAIENGYSERHIMRAVPRPRPEQKAIIPYSEKDVRKLISLCSHKVRHQWRGHQDYTQSRPTALRDLAIVLVLLDTGIRASELCGLRIQDVDMVNRRLRVFGKRSKERSVAFGKGTGKALWRYLVTRPDKQDGDPVFVSYGEIDEPMTRKALFLLVRRLGNRAEIVPAANVHRYRHTFAINFLRNGGNIYALQEMLGHTSLDMVRKYLAIAQADVDEAHRRASPVDHWHL